MDPTDEKRQAAVKRIKARRDFKRHVVIYASLNTVIVVVWLLSRASFFWPIFPMFGWGVGLAIHGWNVYFQNPISEEEIRREMKRTD